ncbi:uncharacterized protein E0L32_011673 [Thyridium curvatum]|uniref:BRCT domain-containing protein n=1 Tax=Thyridium curvatum TaxID=1093900 RepID=A0A507B7X5_9PEZI|nr:uncharacterized protein E0L32_011673 [Thyridium curvatum]TPX18432.1 hypothetical protein E0L32_011673 [Thyridium curvatum]
MSRPAFDPPGPAKSAQPRAAEPRYGRSFDPWNSVALGHQRAETKGPMGWRDNRNWKLHGQFRAGHSGGSRMSDAVGAGSEDFDDTNKVLVPKEVRARAATNVMDMLRNPGAMKTQSMPAVVATSSSFPSLPGGTPGGGGSSSDSPSVSATGATLPSRETTTTTTTEEENIALRRRLEDEQRDRQRANQPRKIFDGLVVYVNGSTHPLVSDHRLKHLLAEHGARMSIHLGRRQVTHVILGRPVAGGGGAGGGLAGGKLEREIRRVGGCGVKFVGVEW